MWTIREQSWANKLPELPHINNLGLELKFYRLPTNCRPPDAPLLTTPPPPHPPPPRPEKVTSTTASPTSAPKRSKRPTKRAEPSNSQNEAVISKESDHVEELFDFDDGIDFPYEDPPLVCCFGAVQKEFLPTVRVAPEQMHPDIYSQWKMLQWNPPEFVSSGWPLPMWRFPT
ncbi:UNVERIFIED_CONTAM: Fructokinase-like 1, chloroplastic [Sesamum radiatum]|uniref:Fructokinase-like 1, chloroplastic n=1 Tax=Sesamum radiatum TaxID=300843 RepID=A0AAW2NMM8_SESRA